MNMRIRGLFSRKTGDLAGQTDRLVSARDTATEEMADLVTSAIGHGIPVAPKMPDDSKTALDAAIAARNLQGEELARNAEAANYDTFEY